MVTQPCIQPRTRNRIPLINGEKFECIRYGTELRHNSDITKFMWERKEYGCFPIDRFPSRIKSVYPLQFEGGRRFFTAYIECFHVDGNPYNSAYFAAVDLEAKRIYVCWIMGRAEACRFSVDSETLALRAAAEEGEYAGVFEVYDRLWGAFEVCRVATVG
jgi:hypothetical protein